MALIILIPAVVCWMELARGSPRSALLNVYLPVLLLLPQYYFLRLPHLPPLSFADAAMLPLGLAMLLTEMRRWKFSWMDFWVLMFAVSTGLSQGLSTQLANGEWMDLFSAQAAASQGLGTNLADGALMFISRVLTAVLPYMAGKLLIEQYGAAGDRMRRKLVSRVVTLLAAVSLVSVYDFVTGGNLWQLAGHRLFPTQNPGWPLQTRWGFGRIAGPYGHAILAGMMFLMGLIYCFWLRNADRGWGARRVIDGVPVTVRGLTLTAVAAGLLMTQSRGPWAGFGLALLFALLTRMLSVGKAVATFLVLTAGLSVAAYYFGNRYTDKAITQASNVEQQDAIYRRDLLTNYIPIVKERKAFGWGVITYPKVDGQVSIDNEYLLLAVTQGLVGLGVFMAIASGSAVRLVRMVGRPLRQEDKLLVFAHLAVLIGLLTTLTTVYMGEQVVPMFFLFAGWVQGMNPARASAGAANLFAPRQEFRRVLV
jgi:hypothetical protein